MDNWIEIKKVGMIMKKSCKVSIIMPSLNVAKYIDECMQSALGQTLAEKEIICVDAGSTDGTWEKILSYADNTVYKGKIVPLQSGIKSYGYQINLALRAAVGEYIAILETDDYVASDMYEQLYTIGVANNADFVKADYDTFITYPDNKRLFDHIMLFKDDKGNYGKVLNPGRNLYLYTNDHNIWKGIYKKQFLLDHGILLNESIGAAFQDIGFTQQVLAKAKKAVYINKSFYRYRIDRKESSINSVEGLKYAYWEFSRLLENDWLREKIIYLDGFYSHMAQSFLCELIKAVRATKYNAVSEHVEPYYRWFKDQILYAIDKNLLSIELYQLYPHLQSIFENIHEFCLRLKDEDLSQKEKKEKFLNSIRDKSVILFCLGTYGNFTIRYLYDHDISILAGCDNNKILWNTKKFGIYVYSPSECTQKFSGCTYVIANKKSRQEMYKQLLDLGVDKKNISICL